MFSEEESKDEALEEQPDEQGDLDDGGDLSISAKDSIHEETPLEVKPSLYNRDELLEK